jgi:hypothetical protein
MIAIDFNPETQVAKLAFVQPITAGADVPVRITFSPVPNEVSALQLGLVSDAASPATLAWTDDFHAENANVWEALLDANDSRLLDALAGKTTLQVGIAIRCTIDGAGLAHSALRLTATPPVLDGPESTVGGPVYYTAPETLAAIAGLTINGVATLAPAAAGTSTVPIEPEIHHQLVRVTASAGGGAFTHKIVLPIADRVSGDRCEASVRMPASANPTISFHTTNDATSALHAIAPDAGAARFYFLLFVFNGGLWELWDAHQIS